MRLTSSERLAKRKLAIRQALLAATNLEKSVEWGHHGNSVPLASSEVLFTVSRILKRAVDDSAPRPVLFIEQLKQNTTALVAAIEKGVKA